ncbi:MAG: AAA family ATPase [Planctomycetota bacterium]
MFLQSLRVRNFRSFKDASLSFERESGDQRKWTVLLGNNGVGKSDLLRAIALVTAGSEALRPLIGKDPSRWIQYRKKECRIDIVLETAAGETRDVSLTLVRGDTPAKAVSRNKQSLAPLDDALEHTHRNYFVMAYGASRRLAPAKAARDERNDQPFRVLRTRTLFDPDATLNPLDTWAAALEKGKKADVRPLLRTLTSFLDGVRIDYDEVAAGRLMFKTPNGRIPLRHLDQARQTTAAWVGDLLFHITQAFGDYRSPLQARGVLMVDELDLHLHPEWQRRLYQFLTTTMPQLQLVVTSYSPLIAQQAGPGEVHLVHRGDDKATHIDAYEGDPSSMLLHQIVMSELFGLQSDESVQVQALKDEYRSLARKKRKSAKEKERIAELRVAIRELPRIERSSLAMPKGMSQLERVYDALKGLKQ